MKTKLGTAVMLLVVMGLLAGGRATAEETNNLIITSFQDGYVTWTNVNSNLYYTVEYKPNLPGTNTPWDGSYRALQDVKSSEATITAPAGVFYRVVGSTNPMHVLTLLPKTGQTTSYQAGDDGNYTKGVAWPNPRFMIGTGVDGTNCVTDNLTGLIWARNANLAGQMTWVDAIAFCTNLPYGGTNGWRLPNVHEMQSLIDYERSTPALCNTSGTGQWTENNPFTGVQSQYYWTSTTYAAFTPYALCVYLDNCVVIPNDKTATLFVWPVRGGQ